MAYFIIITGPQSSGKTSSFKHLKKLHKRAKFIEEVTPYDFKGSDHPKYISTYGIQEALAKKTIALLKKIDPKDNYFMETGPMQIVYLEKYSGLKQANFYYEKFLRIMEHWNPILVFIDTKPEISFKRRRNTYLERIKKHKLQDSRKTVMNTYREKIFRLYPLWHKWLKKFPFKKVIIKNSYKSEAEFKANLDKVILSLISRESLRQKNPRRHISA